MGIHSPISDGSEPIYILGPNLGIDFLRIRVLCSK